MRYLLDTNIFLWWLNNDRKLTETIRMVIKNPRNQIYVSVGSGWEISIKHRLGKLPLKTSLKKCFELAAFGIINVSLDHILKLDRLPIYHKDPFDRILIAQAQVEDLTLISSDKKMSRYKVKLLSSQ